MTPTTIKAWIKPDEDIESIADIYDSHESGCISDFEGGHLKGEIPITITITEGHGIPKRQIDFDGEVIKQGDPMSFIDDCDKEWREMTATKQFEKYHYDKSFFVLDKVKEKVRDMITSVTDDGANQFISREDLLRDLS